MSEKNKLAEKLLYAPKNGYDRLSAEEEKAMNAYCEDYKEFLNHGKTERLCVEYCIELAKEHGFVNARKRDSQDICFVPDGDYAAWLEQRGDAPEPGDIIYNGKAVARHGGIHRFTLGQRRGLGYAAGKRVYVSEIRPDTGEVVLADGDGLYSAEFTASDMRWLVPEPEAPFDCEVRVRHSRTLTHARACPEGGGRLRIVPAWPPGGGPPRGPAGRRSGRRPLKPPGGRLGCAPVPAAFAGRIPAQGAFL